MFHLQEIQLGSKEGTETPRRDEERYRQSPTPIGQRSTAPTYDDIDSRRTPKYRCHIPDAKQTTKRPFKSNSMNSRHLTATASLLLRCNAECWKSNISRVLLSVKRLNANARC
ncbi:hypothetical protein F2P81_017264 [Scophthalmus maximus]|uniref:Uncharacterized protein n=1 Tax=Scophthalmus maximus TaxID=52904 RepID=A0A6A4S860_SCOMX|nr:hypothetical protein F2P81_017264 [Scophthalmus maximus]